MTLALRARIEIDYVLTNEARGALGREGRLFLRKAPGESHGHVAMKLLSFLIFHHEELRIEASAGQHYKPDLLRVDASGHPVQWIDCGRTSITKLDAISAKNRRTFIDIVKRTPKEVASYARLAEARLRLPERIRYLSFDPGFVDAVAERLFGRISLESAVLEEEIYLRIADEALFSGLHWRPRGPRASC